LKRSRFLQKRIPQQPPLTWWKLHALLAENFRRRGFSCGSLLALRVLSEGLYPALSIVLLAYWLGVSDRREALKRGE